MPRLFPGPAPVIERRAAPPVNRVPGPHVYTLTYDNREPETITAESAPEAVALRDGGPDSRLPHTITDVTEVNAWVIRLAGGLDRL